MRTARGCGGSSRLQRCLTPSATPSTQKIGDYYASCMDEKAIEAKGAEPLKPELERIAGINSKAEIADVAADYD